IAAQTLHPTLDISFQQIWKNFDQLSQKTKPIPFDLSFIKPLQRLQNE
ncbi:2-amino-4-hydroxy-6-hydroxymethyldihydropteridine diphosphokinase, partial [Vibrio cyclitrophicus]